MKFVLMRFDDTHKHTHTHTHTHTQHTHTHTTHTQHTHTTHTHANLCVHACTHNKGKHLITTIFRIF